METILERARKYSHIKYTLALVDIIYLAALIFVFMGSGISAGLALKANGLSAVKWLTFFVYLLFIFTLYYILTFPLNYYRGFVLEHKFSLTKQKISDWLLDQFKAILISYIVCLIIFGAFYYILNNFGQYWWLIVALFWIFFGLIFARLMPVIIIPLFFKYKPLSDEVLRQRIINLAQKMQVKILDVFEIDFSKKTLKANAAFLGWGKTRRVILADTLKDKYTHDEIEVILTHEFAHYQKNHLLKLILVNALTTLLLFYLIFKTNSAVLKIFGLVSLQDLAAFPLLILYMTLFGLIMQPLENFISRCFEREADLAAIKISGLKDAFISMMNKLSEQNLSERSPHPVIKFFFFDHPPVEERVKMAESIK